MRMGGRCLLEAEMPQSMLPSFMDLEFLAGVI